MRHTFAITMTIVSVLLVAAMSGTTHSPGLRAETERVGVYDSRAIAIAYAASDFNPVREKMKAYEAAKKAGDQATVRELDSWGQSHQRQLHRQGFGRVPVTDLLEHIKDRLPELAGRLGVQAIVFECTYAGPEVETVDVTLELVKLYNPSEKTMTTVREVMKQKPVDLEEIEREGQVH